MHGSRRIGVFGGTFNPIHCGHIHILNEFIRRLKLSEAVIIPTKTPPHKNAPELASAECRLEMCRLAVADVKGCRATVSDIEIRRGGKSYTVDTLRELSEIYPEAKFFLIMGEDMFLTVDKWKDPETIMRLAVLCASPRSVDGLSRLESFGLSLKERYGAEYFVENIKYINISSTGIRQLIGRGKDIEELVSASVAGYIKENGLYNGAEG